MWSKKWSKKQIEVLQRIQTLVKSKYHLYWSNYIQKQNEEDLARIEKDLAIIKTSKQKGCKINSGKALFRILIGEKKKSWR